MKWALLFLITLLAFCLRLYHISSNPPSLYWDEVAFGYNAQSIIQTGADEYGHRFPFYFESFQDFKLPGYLYSVVPFIRIFGLTDLAVRLPSVLFGTVSVVMIFYLVHILYSARTGLLSSLLLAISPWAVQFSRAGFEASGALCFLLIGAVCILKGHLSRKMLYLGIFSMILGLCFYNGVRLVIPVFTTVLILYSWRKLHFKRSDAFIWSAILIVVVIPLLSLMFGSAGLRRFTYTSVFNDSSILSNMSAQRLDDSGTFFSKTFHNKYLAFSQLIFRNYIFHFSPDFLLNAKDQNIRQFVPNIGLYDGWMIPFLLIGLISLHKNKSAAYVVVCLLMASPILAAFTLPSPHALRSYSMLPALIILTSLGLARIAKYKKIGRIIFFSLICTAGTAMYLHQLFYHYSQESQMDWAFGQKEIYQKLSVVNPLYERFYITGKYWRPYIFMLFYTNYSSAAYQRNPSHDHIGNFFFGHAGFDTSDPYYNYKSSPDAFNRLKKDGKTLFVLAPDEVPDNFEVVDSINDAKGNPVYVFAVN